MIKLELRFRKIYMLVAHKYIEVRWENFKTVLEQHQQIHLVHRICDGSKWHVQNGKIKLCISKQAPQSVKIY